ncbi:MAG: hypothetical protein ABSG96_19640 [Terracidiphilus sp.]
MQTDLRPMSLGEILDRTAQLYRNNFVLFAGIAAVYAGVLLVLNLVQLGSGELFTHLHMTKQLPWVTLSFLLVMIPLIFIGAGAAVAANNRAVAWVNLGQPATIRGAYLSIVPRLGRYLWLMTIIGFIIYIPFVILIIGFSVFLWVYARPRGFFVQGGGNGDAHAAIIVVIVFVGFIILWMAALVYAVFMGLRYSLAVPASVVEDLPARKAIRRSIELSEGSRGRIFVLGLLIAVIQLGLIAITQVFFIVAVFAAAKRHGQPSLWLQILQQIVGFFTNSFIGPMYATGLTLFYYDQRVRKEGFDIEWMMEAAGMNAHVPSAGDEAAATPLQVPGDAVEPWPELEPAPATEPVPDGESAAQGGPLEALEQAPADESGPAQLPNESNHG